MKRWPSLTLRTLGAVDVVFGLTGVYFLGRELASFHWHGFPYRNFPYEPQAYSIMVSVDALFVIFIFPTGLAVGALNRRGLWMTKLLLGAELVWIYGWVLATLLARGAWAPLGRSMAAVSGVGSMGIGLQIITGYPLWGLVLTNVAYRKLYPPGEGTASNR